MRETWFTHPDPIDTKTADELIASYKSRNIQAKSASHLTRATGWFQRFYPNSGTSQYRAGSIKTQCGAENATQEITY
ncbi:hypothetical protein [[Curtobacterium] plantarum]|uniref:Uncharacterized protein n=1 Tax=[Curtobacterium] plantarum TaxID=221276 RepID=A0ABT9T9F0_9GAMM|nr:hypothetical protein [[Curtobacterium] plantarum]MDQ0019023.1 hypothetical protein [[Curtobacterium] plantarum]